jgi:excisionase family DNA binding protein
MSEEFLTVKEAAKILKLGYPTVLGIIKRGKISFMRFGRAYRLRLEDLIAYGYKEGSGGELNKRYKKYY